MQYDKYTKPYTMEDLEQALTDLLDGSDASEIREVTGLPNSRCKEIIKLRNEVMAELHYKKYA